MILKLLLLAGVIFVVYILFFKKSAPLKERPNGTKPKKKSEEALVDEMVECSSCGVYVEISEAILSNGNYYCSKECVIKGK